MRKRITVIVMITTLLIANSANASSVGNFLNKLGTFYNSNLSTSPQNFNMTDGASYTTLGSVSLRAPDNGNPLYGLFNVTLPTFRAGCNGIDFNTGGLFFIQDPQLLVQRLTSYGTSVVYGMLISMASSLPVIGDTLEYLQDLQRKYGDQLMDGCELGKMIVEDTDSLFDEWFEKTDEEHKTNRGTDASKAKHQAKTTAAVTEFNIAALSLAGNSYETLNLAMSLAGTFVMVKGAQADSPKPMAYEKTFTVEEYISGKLNGKRELYCQNITNEASVVPAYTGPGNGAVQTKPPCLLVAKRPVARVKKIQDKYSDLIMAQIYRGRYSKAQPGSRMGGTAIATPGNTFGAHLAGMTVNELNGILLSGGIPFVKYLNLQSLKYDLKKASDYAKVRATYADPLAPYLALLHIRYVTARLLDASTGAQSQNAVKFPEGIRANYLESIRHVAEDAYKFKFDVMKDYEKTKIFAETFEAAKKEMQLNAFQNSLVSSR